MSSTDVSVTEHINAVLTSTSIEEVWAMHVRKMAEYHFDRLIYGATRFRTHGEFGDVTDALILTNHNEEYITHFFDSEMYLNAPMAVWVANNNGACSWQYAEDQSASGQLSDDEEELLAFNREFGIIAGYSIGFEDASQRTKGGIGLCARSGLTQIDVDAIWEKSGDEILMLNNLMNLRVLGLPYAGRRKPLTSRQREVLQWVADGKTVQDVGVIMDLTPATVEKHLRLAREALNVTTTAQAVLKASVQNQFFLFEDVGELRKKR